jgi:hypothetical protein
MGHSIPKWISCSYWWIPSRKTKNVSIGHQCVLCGRPYLWEQMWKCHKSPQSASVHGIVHGTLGYRNVSGYWDQKQLREYHIQMYMGLYLLCLMWWINQWGITGLNNHFWWNLVTSVHTGNRYVHKHLSNKEVQNSEFCSELWPQSFGMPEVFCCWNSRHRWDRQYCLFLHHTEQTE